ncbi:calcium-transporting ATPase 3, endoplasmic reticulum-type-like [Phragmites australis]|uniref:calcium-transporting ATPase 3, endoplasmic reticulum-type-like n=1 Tax=Phragmites australis TaxID=29695 RepID=UPI002D78D15D|nr:calcium-transporting ATPase 3, endoplasmic reticulum-type-like [Phragmites australis]
MEDAYAKSVAEVLQAFGVDRTKGLSDSQVEQHTRLYGKNVLPQEESKLSLQVPLQHITYYLCASFSIVFIIRSSWYRVFPYFVF